MSPCKRKASKRVILEHGEGDEVENRTIIMQELIDQILKYV